MAQRLPVVGSDNTTWGTVLDGYLQVGHGADGTHKLVYSVDERGAVGNGTTDDTSIIQAALTACPAGGVVLLGPHTYATSAPLTIPPQVALVGMHASHIDTSAASIKPLATFAGAAVILLEDQTTGGYAIASTEQRLSHFLLDCSSLPGTTIDGIQAQGSVHGVVIEDVQIYKAPNHGIALVTNASGTPYSWRCVRVVANACTGYGFSIAMTDCTFTDCEALANLKSGWFLGSCPNTHFTNCRAEWNGFSGFELSGAWGSGTASGGCTFTGCSTDRNTQNGVLITATGTVPVTFANHMARRDGRNAGTGGGSYAGFHCTGSTLPVIVNGLTVFPGVDDNGTGTNSPQYGFSIGSTSTSVVLGGGYIQGATAGINDDGTNTWYRGPNVLEASGTTAAPSLSTPSVGLAQAVNLDAVTHALGIADPREHGLVAWAYDPANVASGKAGTAGTVYLAAVYVNRPVTVSKILWGINVAGSGATAAENFVGLYNSAGTLLQSAGVDAAVTATGLQTTSITATALTPGLYWVAFLFNATGMPQVYRGQDLNATLMNAGIASAATYRFATNGTAQTTLPASITPASNAAAQFAYWAALS